MLGGGAVILYLWWAGSQTTAAPVATTTTTAAPPPTTTTTAAPPPAATPPPATPPPAAAVVAIVGPVTTNVNNSLSANVSVNGTITNVSIIYPALSAWDTTGKNVTASLTALGVNIPSLAQQMLASYQASNPGSTFQSGLSGGPFLPFIWGRGMGPGLGQVRQVRRVLVPAHGQNYVRPGAPMRRIG